MILPCAIIKQGAELSLKAGLLCRFFTQKHGSKLFAEYGITGKKLRWNEDPEAFARWKDGQTGLPLVDANMRELKQTGLPTDSWMHKTLCCCNIGQSA